MSCVSASRAYFEHFLIVVRLIDIYFIEFIKASPDVHDYSHSRAILIIHRYARDIRSSHRLGELIHPPTYAVFDERFNGSIVAFYDIRSGEDCE